MKNFTSNLNNLLVVDGTNLAFRWKHTGSYNSYAEKFVDTVNSLAGSYNAKDIIVLSDWGKSSYREALDPEYKGNRKKLRETQTDEEAEQFQEFLEELNRAISLCKEEGMYTLKILKVEADDIAAYITENFNKKIYEHVWLISSDGDWDLLLNSTVSRFSFKTRKEYTLENWKEEHSCEDPDEFICIKAIEGDKGDNIEGVQGVGPKRASDLVRQFGSAIDLCESLPLEGTAKYIQSLNSSKERILLNLELVDLINYHEEAIGDENIQTIKEQLGDILE